VKKAGILIFIFLISLSVNSQKTQLPITYHASEIKNVLFIEFSEPNMERLRYQDSIDNAAKNKPWRFGYKYDVDLNPENTGQWQGVGEGFLWTCGITGKNARSFNFILDRFSLPEGAVFWLSTGSDSIAAGPYSKLHNNSDGMLGTGLVLGDSCILNLWVPSAEVRFELNIAEVVYGYRLPDRFNSRDNQNRVLEQSGDCHYDVLCPDATGWENQIRSVAMILSGGNGFCTGALVNNTAQDGTPYLLTANHCVTGSPSTMVFRFNWNSPVAVCGAVGTSADNGPPYDEVYGATLRASSGTSDFALLELNQVPPLSYQVYYSGWDMTDNLVSQVAAIHHPSGDVKKISFDDDALTKTSWSGAQCWMVSQWEKGVTESGSSGSPLFNSSGQIIGQLFGGAADCSGTTGNGQPDYFGRFGISWNNGSVASARLLDWLDPLSSGMNSLSGYDPAASVVSLDAALENILIEDVICNDSIAAEVTIRNQGTDTIYSFVIDYYTDISSINVFNWTGVLPPMYTVIVSLPEFFTSANQTRFFASVYSPNGGTDLNSVNDTMSRTIKIVPDGYTISLNLQTDCYGGENTWTLKDDFGVLWYSGGPYPGSSGVNISEEYCLSAGKCYQFKLMDSFGDGMNSTAWGCSVVGDYVILDENQNILAEMIANDALFGSVETNDFCLNPNGVGERVQDLGLRIYPNPATGEVFLEGAQHSFYTLYNSQGKKLKFGAIAGNKISIDISDCSSGIYILEVMSNSHHMCRKKLIIK
jgi:hypothetical protein